MSLQPLRSWSRPLMLIGGALIIVLWIATVLSFQAGIGAQDGPEYGGRPPLFSYVNYARLLLLPLLFVLAGSLGFSPWQLHRSGRLGAGGAVLILSGLASLVVGQLLHIWLQGSGSGFDRATSPVFLPANAVYVLGLLLVLTGQVLYAVARLRGRVLPQWPSWLLIVGSLTMLLIMVMMVSPLSVSPLSSKLDTFLGAIDIGIGNLALAPVLAILWVGLAFAFASEASGSTMRATLQQPPSSKESVL